MKKINRIFDIVKLVFGAIKDFFMKEDCATRTTLQKLDYADILISLLPLAIFGCLLFGLRAVLVLLLCVAILTGFDFLWNLIFKKEKAEINYSAVVVGLVLGLTLSSRLNIFLVILCALLTAALTKTVFKEKPLYVIFPLLIVRVLLGLIFFKAFDFYSFPFMNTVAQKLPLDYIFTTASFIYPAKYLFFGLHSGNIGETSILLLLISGIYLTVRKTINPIIPVGFVLSLGALSLIFGQSISIALLGGSHFFVAIFLTMDYSFKTTPRYKKILYGIFCGVMTFIIRIIFHTEGALVAVLIANFIFIYLNRRNIKRGLKFIKNPDFKKLANKFKKLFWV